MTEANSRHRSRSSSFSSAFESVSDLFPAVAVTRSLWRQPQQHDDQDHTATDGAVKTQMPHRHEEWYEVRPAAQAYLSLLSH